MTIAARLSMPQDLREQVKRICAVQIRRTETRTVRVQCAQSVGDDHTWTPVWTGEEMRLHQQTDDDLRVIYAAKSSENGICPEWKDITFESLGCKYYHGEWGRLVMVEKLLTGSGKAPTAL